jgi:hypothetical protein
MKCLSAFKWSSTCLSHKWCACSRWWCALRKPSRTDMTCVDISLHCISLPIFLIYHLLQVPLRWTLLHQEIFKFDQLQRYKPCGEWKACHMFKYDLDPSEFFGRVEEVHLCWMCTLYEYVGCMWDVCDFIYLLRGTLTKFLFHLNTIL